MPDAQATREVRLLELPTRASLAAAHDRDPEPGRRLVVVHLVDADGNEGWGECSALNRPGYAPEWADGAYRVLCDTDDPDLRLHPMAAAAESMARLDLELRRDEVALVDAMTEWAGGGSALGDLPLAAVVGLPTDPTAPDALDNWLAEVAARVADGARRLKLKVTPEWLDGPVRAVHDRLAGTDVDLQLDANGSLSPDEFDALVSVAGFLSAIEQPFAGDDVGLDLVDRLARSCPTTILLDEGAPTAEVARLLLDGGVLRPADAKGAGVGLALKPPRLGGLPLAVELLRWCAEAALPASAGGMLECGLGRHALAAFAALPGMTVAGDVSPARQWLAEDPWPDLVVADGRIEVPRRPGVAPLPDLDVLDRVTVERTITT